MKMPKQREVKTLIQGLQAAPRLQPKHYCDPLKRLTLVVVSRLVLAALLNSRHVGSAFKVIQRLRTTQVNTNYGVNSSPVSNG